LAFAPQPAWPADLPEGPLRDRVAGPLAMRRLLPLVRIRGHATGLQLTNEDAKTVVRLQVLAMHCDAPDGAGPRDLWPRVRLLPVLGYEDALEALAARIVGEMDWPRAPDALYDEALAAIGREAGDYTSKLDVPLKPQQMAIDATRGVLLTLLDTIERNLPGARANLDSEFLHDLRVATRRTRSALAQIRRVLPERVVDEFKQRFAWLGQVTGPTRDLDVFLLELPHYRAMLPAAMAADLDALEQHLRKTHAREQARLKRKLGGAEMKALLQDWRALLEADVMPGEPGWFADLPIERVASARIWRMFRKVVKAGRAVTEDGPAEEMHELRKDCKKLRYLIEFFRGAYPADELKPIIRALKDLLDNLGEFQDLEVQAGELRDFAGQLDAGDQDSLRSVMAIGALVADLLRRQQAAHARFAGCFAAFDSADNRAAFKRLFKDTR
jgi:CHAD domain-containing protein